MYVYSYDYVYLRISAFALMCARTQSDIYIFADWDSSA